MRLNLDWIAVSLPTPREDIILLPLNDNLHSPQHFQLEIDIDVFLARLLPEIAGISTVIDLQLRGFKVNCSIGYSGVTLKFITTICKKTS